MWLWNKIPVSVWLCVVVGILGYQLHESNVRARRYKEESEMFEGTITDLNQKIRHTEIRMNDSVALYQAEVKSLSYSAENLKARYEALLRASKLKTKDVGAMTSVAVKTASRDTVVALVDTFGGFRAVLDDNFVKIDVAIGADRKAVIDYEIRDSLTVISVQKRHSILFGLIKWRSHKSTRVINHNPKARIVSLETINVIE